MDGGEGGATATTEEVAVAPEQTRARYPDESGYVERDGVRVYYEVYGSGEPTIFLLPTWAIIHSRQWKMQIPFLARHVRVLTFDGRGSGRSDSPTTADAYDGEEYVADAIAVMDATRTERAVLVGFSRSGGTAIMQAAAHPDRTLGAFVIGPGILLTGPPPAGYQGLPAQGARGFDEIRDTYEGWEKYNRHYWLRDYPGFVEFFMAEMFREPHSTKQIEDAVGWGLENNGETLILTRGTRVRTEAEVQAICRRVRCPVLVVHGIEDQQASYTSGVALAEAVGGDLVLLEGSAHAPHLRDPVLVNRLLYEFIRSLPRSRT
jgi:pimeloyl-ACP methyl ester carboxylesterase